MTVSLRTINLLVNILDDMNHPLVQLQHLDVPEVFNVRRLHVGLVLDGVPIDQHGAPTGAQQDLGGPLHERIAHQLPIFWIYFVHTFHLHLPSVYLSRDSSLNYYDPLKYCSLFLCSSNLSFIVIYFVLT